MTGTHILAIVGVGLVGWLAYRALFGGFSGNRGSGDAADHPDAMEPDGGGGDGGGD